LFRTEDVEGQLIEKQAEYIRYLEEQKANLNKQILELTQRMESFQSQDTEDTQSLVCLQRQNQRKKTKSVLEILYSF
jgi:hypothetical protein